MKRKHVSKMPFTFVSFCARFDLIWRWCIGGDGDNVKQTTSRMKIFPWTAIDIDVARESIQWRKRDVPTQTLGFICSESAVSIVRTIYAPFFCALNGMLSYFICEKIRYELHAVDDQFCLHLVEWNRGWSMIGYIEPMRKMAQLMHLCDLRRGPNDLKKKKKCRSHDEKKSSEGAEPESKQFWMPIWIFQTHFLVFFIKIDKDNEQKFPSFCSWFWLYIIIHYQLCDKRGIQPPKRRPIGIISQLNVIRSTDRILCFLFIRRRYVTDRIVDYISPSSARTD